MSKVIDVIKSRVSCREYSSKKVSLKKLNEIIEAGKSAPSAMNRQIADMLVVRKASNMEALRKLSMQIRGKDCMYGANTIVLVHAPREDNFTAQDCACVLENIFLAAAALKIDSCWINQFDELFSSKEGLKLKKRLGIPEENRVVGSAVLGYRKEGAVIAVKAKDNIKVTIK
ncbi:MAG: nitroreductase family protein [Bacilli bacterium]|nr:nitroreductase family protein [Bacilli bacterium]